VPEPKYKVGDCFRPLVDMYYDHGHTWCWKPILPDENQPYGKVYANQVYKIIELVKPKGPNGPQAEYLIQFVMVHGSREISVEAGDEEYDDNGRVMGGCLTIDQIKIINEPPSSDKIVPRFVAILEME